jgi:murein DD-endopeptidase MepM/ murein hydrolase activator NlpD
MRVLRGDDGRWYRYHHLSEYEEGVDPDDRVVRGQTIGYMGKTGNTQWTHLHFEVWVGASNPRDGTAIDPVPLIAFPDSVQVDASRACDV